MQLREKSLPRREIELAAQTFRRLCDNHSALFIVNDDPDLARACDADGVHVGQDDIAAAEARALLGPDAIIGLSTHSEEQIAASATAPVDYVSVGPIWETPTKQGRPAVGLELISHAAARRPPPLLRDRRHRRVERSAGDRGRGAAALRRAGDPRRRGSRPLPPKSCAAAFAPLGEEAPGA